MARRGSLSMPFWISAIDREGSPNGPSEEFLKRGLAVDTVHRGPSFYSLFCLTVSEGYSSRNVLKTL